MKNLAKLFVVLFLVSGLFMSSCIAGTVKAPWDDFGYEKLTEFHLRYYYIFGEAIDEVLKGEMSWEDAIDENTGIVDVWFKSKGNLFRLDRYIEKLGAICKSYEGPIPETTSYNDKPYLLKERIFQKGKELTHYSFDYRTQVGYDDVTKQAIAENCYYKKYSSEKETIDQRTAISWMGVGHVSLTGFVFYLAQEFGDVDLEEAREASLELDKLMNPSRYKKIIEAWKVKKMIAGRTAFKDYDSPPYMRTGAADGYQFIDKELGIGLEGYLEGCPKSWLYPETKFKEPKLVYKAILVETKVSPDVFKDF